MGLLVLTLHHLKLDSVQVDEVSALGQREVIEGRVIHERTDAAHGDVSHSDVVLAVVGKARHGVVTLLGNLALKSLKERATSEKQVVGVLGVTTKLADLLAQGLGERLVSRGRGDLVGSNKGAMPPPSRSGAVETSSCSDSGGVGEDGEQTRNLLGVLSAVPPQHVVEGLRPTLGHVVKLVLKQAGENGKFTLGMLGNRLALGAVHDADAIVFKLREGHGDTSVDFPPREGNALDIRRIRVADGIVVGVASDGRGVIALDGDRDVTFPAREGLLVALKSLEEWLVLNGLSESRPLDVIIEGSIRNVA